MLRRRRPTTGRWRQFVTGRWESRFGSGPALRVEVVSERPVGAELLRSSVPARPCVLGRSLLHYSPVMSMSLFCSRGVLVATVVAGLSVGACRGSEERRDAGGAEIPKGDAALGGARAEGEGSGSATGSSKSGGPSAGGTRAGGGAGLEAGRAGSGGGSVISGAGTASGGAGSATVGEGGAAGAGRTTELLPAVKPLPTAEQAAWQRRELTAFFHFGMNTFTDVEWGTGADSPTLFNPTSLDAAQWVSVVKKAGFRQAILVAKHHDGFCLWPSKFTEYSVKNSPWKGGKGDLVAEFTQAAHAAGLKTGLYLSPWDRHEATFGTSAYNAYFRNQLTELLSNYGEIDELWFDGAGSDQQTYDWESFYGLSHQLQPHALLAITGPDIRWVGNEAGIAPAGETSVQQVDGNPVWYPAESDVSIRPGWFYHSAEDSSLKSLDQLLDIYFKSVGRNATLLLNVPPDRRGLIAGADITRLTEFSSALSEIFQQNFAVGGVASADTVFQKAPAFAPGLALDEQLSTYWAAAAGATRGRLEIDLGAQRQFNWVSLREPIELGERATAFHLEVERSGSWETIATGTVIGQRNLLGFPMVTAQKMALVIDQARGTPAIAELGVYASTRVESFASGSLLAHKPVQVSNVHPQGTVFGGDRALDDDQQTRWATADGTRSAWLEVDLGTVQSIGKMEIYEFAPRITAFQLQYRTDASSAWAIAYSGTSAGKSFATTFPSVQARYVRLNITAASDSPTLWEFRVYPPVI